MRDAELTFLPAPAIAIAVAAVFAAIILLAVATLLWGMAQWAKKPAYRVGEYWGGARAEVVEWSGREGYVRAGGELWRARAAQAFEPGETVRVAGVDGLVLEVVKP